MTAQGRAVAAWLTAAVWKGEEAMDVEGERGKLGLQGGWGSGVGGPGGVGVLAGPQAGGSQWRRGAGPQGGGHHHAGVVGFAGPQGGGQQYHAGVGGFAGPQGGGQQHHGAGVGGVGASAWAASASAHDSPWFSQKAHEGFSQNYQPNRAMSGDPGAGLLRRESSMLHSGVLSERGQSGVEETRAAELHPPRLVRTVSFSV